MGFERRILHYSPDLGTLLGDLVDLAVEGCWFELNRLGGCGSGEVVLKSRFPERGLVELGDWIAFEPTVGNRWYLGRVEQRTTSSPAKVILRLEGMGIELNEVFPGGFGRNVGDGVPPHRYARTDLFYNDPDYVDETLDSVNEPDEVVRLLMQQYVVPATHIQYIPSRVESGGVPGQFLSMKFRGEESIRTILKELALRAYHASWGVDAAGEFFFLQKRASVLETYREGTDLLRLEESTDGDLIVNRVLLTGDYVYYMEESGGGSVRGFYRWRGNYVQPTSRDLYGERRLKMWVPWIRTSEDSRQFVKEMFRVYSQPVSKYLVRVQAEGDLPVPWQGRVQVESKEGVILAVGTPETIRIDFDRVPILSLTIGPEDPQTHWPEPPQDERWEVGNIQLNGGQTSDQLTFSSNELTEFLTSSEEESSEESVSSSLSSSAASSSEGITSEETGASESSSGTETNQSSESGSSGMTESSASSGETGPVTSEILLTENSSGGSFGESSSSGGSETSSGESSGGSESGSGSEGISGSEGGTESSGLSGESSGGSDGSGGSGGESSGGESNGSNQSGGSGGESSGGGSGESGDPSGGDPSGGSGSGGSGGSNGSGSSDESSYSYSSLGTIIVPCCNTPMSEMLFAEFSNSTDCAEWEGVTVDMVSTGGGSWSGEVIDGPEGIIVTLSCRTSPQLEWVLEIEGNPCQGTYTQPAGGACNPLNLSFDNISMGIHCCANSGQVSIQITE
ncbi:MAG: hypothetical protein KDA68_07895 [Planctomycetaceae bacterium]|nr:hypothetical protein [Planctomycetaceae bacterium]